MKKFYIKNAKEKEEISDPLIHCICLACPKTNGLKYFDYSIKHTLQDEKYHSKSLTVHYHIQREEPHQA